MIEIDRTWLPQHDVLPAWCCLCNGRGGVEWIKEFKVNGDRFNIGFCPRDRLYFTAPRPGGRWLHTIYGRPDYYASKDPMYGVASSGVVTAELRLDEIKKYAPDASSLLEIGPGPDRHVLKEAALRDFADTVGVDDYERERRIGRLFDVVAAYSVLEHVPNPLGLLDYMAGHAKATGILVVRVPIVTEKGPWLSLLDHLWHFTDSSMARLFDRARLSIVDVFPSGTFVSGTKKLKSKTFILKP